MSFEVSAKEGFEILWEPTFYDGGLSTTHQSSLRPPQSHQHPFNFLKGENIPGRRDCGESMRVHPGKVTAFRDTGEKALGGRWETIVRPTTTYCSFFTHQMGKYGTRKTLATPARLTMAIEVNNVVVVRIAAQAEVERSVKGQGNTETLHIMLAVRP
jgi:hypothetical protein